MILVYDFILNANAWEGHYFQFPSIMKYDVFL